MQAALVVGTLLAVWGAVSNAQYNLTRLNMTSGFGFLERGTGWNYSFSLVERSINDSYAYTLFIGLLNTLFVGFICIVTTTIFGFLIGTMRDVRHPALRFAASVYVQIFRNIPLILQAIFLYAILIHMGGPRQAVSLGDVAFLSGRGAMLPGLNVSPTVAVALLLASLALGVALILARPVFWRGLALWAGGSLGLALAVALVLLVQTHANFWLTLPAAVIIGREIVVSALREWMAEMGARAHVAVSQLGKYKTALQMVALVVLLANPPEFTLWVMLGYVLLALSAVLTLWSMVVYLIAAWPHLRPDSDQNSAK